MIWRDKPELWGSPLLRGSSSVFSPPHFPIFCLASRWELRCLWASPPQLSAASAASSSSHPHLRKDESPAASLSPWMQHPRLVPSFLLHLKMWPPLPYFDFYAAAQSPRFFFSNTDPLTHCHPRCFYQTKACMSLHNPVKPASRYWHIILFHKSCRFKPIISLSPALAAPCMLSARQTFHLSKINLGAASPGNQVSMNSHSREESSIFWLWVDVVCNFKRLEQ